VILLRFHHQAQVDWGILLDDTVYTLRGDLYGSPQAGRPVAPLDQVRLLAPAVPTKVVAVGRNYAEHAAEFGNPPPPEPLLFLKPPSAVIGPGEAIVLPRLSQHVDHEAELAVIIGRPARHVRREDALDYVLGYTCANDVTARDLQARDGQWTRAKSFDTFCPLGPWVVAGIDPRDLAVEAFVNGERRQASRTSDLIFGPRELVSFVSGIMTLEPGDVVLTGTPAGVGPLAAGDAVEIRIEGIGSLVNPVA